jgi:hypothetical protein
MSEDITEIPERARKVILSLSSDIAERLPALVEQWVRDRIAWVAVVGHDCSAVENRIDALLVGDGADRARFMMTTAHPDETIEVVTDFMLSLVGEYEGDVAIVEL